MNPVQLFRGRKKDYPGDCVLLIRVGDFYETYEADAQKIASVLGLTVIARTSKTESVKMAGFPVKSLERHLTKLVKAGVRVVLAELES